METGTGAPVTLINVLSVDPDKQRQLVDLLRENTETVIRTLPGWIATSLIASTDGKQVVIHSQWETPGDVEGMRADPRMRAYFPKIAALATMASTTGTVVMAHRR
ncbi:antibiotic biosynthesis monooxygenase [Alsobacter sp. SYSU M60028]|uniref:Antibiotic biosynthesis monooxygenase n=1 Tax=Alsobacter ponti TaxID=2962936 RepID=A0ABT1L8L5_9HYPH|nr:antibiotic biosynthesis monooxygenase family protein [Alsobacter ponti]MCP8937749.1 antibiotic biosynthesis monooxygenase [Alsobacter ponti]